MFPGLDKKALSPNKQEQDEIVLGLLYRTLYLDLKIKKRYSSLMSIIKKMIFDPNDEFKLTIDWNLIDQSYIRNT